MWICGGGGWLLIFFLIIKATYAPKTENVTVIFLIIIVVLCLLKKKTKNIASAKYVPGIILNSWSLSIYLSIYVYIYSFHLILLHTYNVGCTAIPFDEEIGRCYVTRPRSHSRWWQSWDLTQAFLVSGPLPAPSAYTAFQRRRRLKITGNSSFSPHKASKSCSVIMNSNECMHFLEAVF